MVVSFLRIKASFKCSFMGISSKSIKALSFSAVQFFLRQTVKRTPFDRQLMVCGPKNSVLFWVQTSNPIRQAVLPKTNKPARISLKAEPKPEPDPAAVPISVEQNETKNLMAYRLLRGIGFRPQIKQETEHRCNANNNWDNNNRHKHRYETTNQSRQMNNINRDTSNLNSNNSSRFNNSNVN
ncbi:unnamed protein product [Brachionus calyciflorus]|uniref:Uncharacterized protein n=1 Tax=Brachionus calyciflorus TaxID=104777 RepID=A0A814M604_9BILA|nr:unnamed protein product [Brachionus calyciflorus]